MELKKVSKPKNSESLDDIFEIKNDKMNALLDILTDANIDCKYAHELMEATEKCEKYMLINCINEIIRSL